MIEVRPCLRHGYASDTLSHNHQSESEQQRQGVAEPCLPVRKQDAGDHDLEHCDRLRGIVFYAVGEQQEAGHFCARRVPARRGVELEEVEDAERGDEVWEPPELVAVVREVGSEE